jgi:hypothetical protein
MNKGRQFSHIIQLESDSDLLGKMIVNASSCKIRLQNAGKDQRVRLLFLNKKNNIIASEYPAKTFALLKATHGKYAQFIVYKIYSIIYTIHIFDLKKEVAYDLCFEQYLKLNSHFFYALSNIYSI